jgi:hypothetical protein
MATWLLLCLCLLGGSQALYFHIQESETKCFSEELPDETVVVGMGLMLVLDQAAAHLLRVLDRHVQVPGPGRVWCVPGVRQRCGDPCAGLLRLCALITLHAPDGLCPGH